MYPFLSCTSGWVCRLFLPSTSRTYRPCNSTGRPSRGRGWPVYDGLRRGPPLPPLFPTCTAQSYRRWNRLSRCSWLLRSSIHILSQAIFNYHSSQCFRSVYAYQCLCSPGHALLSAHPSQLSTPACPVPILLLLDPAQCPSSKRDFSSSGISSNGSGCIECSPSRFRCTKFTFPSSGSGWG